VKIEAVDFFYLSMPEVTTEGDGSQDALLVRVAAGGLVGWGECEASPLVSIAAFVCPMSHGACRPVGASVIGEQLEGPADISRIASQIELDSMDLLQAPHTWSGIEMALWDLLGKFRGEPVWKLLGYRNSFRKLPYASQLFGETPQQTYELAANARRDQFRAVKFGWGPIGRGELKTDLEHFAAAREGLGKDSLLMVDVGQIFGENVEAAAARDTPGNHSPGDWRSVAFRSPASSRRATPPSSTGSSPSSACRPSSTTGSFPRASSTRASGGTGTSMTRASASVSSAAST